MAETRRPYRLPSWLTPSTCLSLLVVTAVAFQLLLLLHHRNSAVLHPDEAAFLGNTRLLMHDGLTQNFLTSMRGQAFGPLLNIVHALASPLTHLAPPEVRVLHQVLFAVFMVLAFVVGRSFAPQDAWAQTMRLCAVPMLWHQAGGVWSHIPAMIFATAGTWLLLMALDPIQESGSRAIILAGAGGILYGVAILGRATYLSALACLPLLLAGQPRMRRTAMLLCIFCVPAVCLPVPVFVTWGGLVPADVAAYCHGLNPWHLVLNLAYGFIMVLLVSPAWLRLGRGIISALLVVSALAFVVNCVWLKWTLRPLGSVVANFLPETALRAYDLAFPAVAVGLAAGMIVAGVRFFLQHRSDGRMLFLLASAFAMLASAMTVTYWYSSDYALQCLPFMIPLLAISGEVNWLTVARTLTGAVLGLGAYAGWLSSLHS